MNKAKCLICGDVIESKSVHDWVSCKGGHIFLDGGNECHRWGTLKPDVGEKDIQFLDS